MNNTITFQGTIVANPFSSEDYKVYGMDVDSFKFPSIKRSKYGSVTVVGNVHDLEEGIEYFVSAQEQSNKHGVQYKIINIKRDRPRTEMATRLFLEEILESKSQVDEIMKNYPDIIDRVMNNRLDDIDLKKLYNIGEFRFNVIKRKIIENFALAEMVDTYKGFFDFKILKKLFDKYGSIEKVGEELKENPYKCLCGLSRIAFKTADKILLDFDKECKNMIAKGEVPPVDFGFDLLSSAQRQKAAIMFLLEENENNGNTRMDIKELKTQSEALASKSISHFVDVVKNDKHIHFDKDTLSVSLMETYNTEKYISNRILDGLSIENKWNINYEKFKVNCDITLTDEQYQILPTVCDNNIWILNGSAGSGKSQTTKSVIDMLKANHKSFLLFSPTGRAAKILSEYTKETASTIHRGLGYKPPEWSYNEECKLFADIIIIDETSMIDVFLMRKLIEAIDFNRTKLLMIGDSNQIPSVGAGNVFYDLINSDKIKIISLTKIFRYGKGGQLTVATKTRRCETWLENKEGSQIFGEDKGYIFVSMQQEKIINNVVELYKKLLNSGYKREDIMILSSYNKGDYGTVNINKYIQPISNENVKLKGIHINHGDIKFYEGDLVIQTVNNYKAKLNTRDSWVEKETFVPNGEIGVITKISYGDIYIQFDEEVIYGKEQLAQVKLAYSISCHKSQGGNARVVILITPKSHTYMLNSNLIYVGQTRAKEKVFHFGEVDTVNRAIKKKADFNRKTHLKDLLSSITKQI